MQRKLESETEEIYRMTIDKVLQKMQMYMRESGYHDSLLVKIRERWEKNLQTAPRSKFAHIVPLKHLHPPAKKLSPKPEPKPEPVLDRSSTSSPEPSASSVSDYSDAPEVDPALAEFDRIKQVKEEQQKNEEVKEEEEFSESSDLLMSDDDTNLDEPDAKGIIHGLHEGIKRKGSSWAINFEACVFQECGKCEKFYKNVTASFNFINS
jgi:hypothetical protein